MGGKSERRKPLLQAIAEGPTGVPDNGDGRALSFQGKSRRKYSNTAISGAVFAALLFVASAPARNHSELNGTWNLIPANSDFGGQSVVRTGTVTIQDREGIIIVSRSFVYEGATETFFYRDVTDGEHNTTFHTGKDLKSKSSWDHDVLNVKTTQSGLVTLESYSLAANGNMTVTVARPARKSITLVFQRN